MCARPKALEVIKSTSTQTYTHESNRHSFRNDFEQNEMEETKKQKKKKQFRHTQK